MIKISGEKNPDPTGWKRALLVGVRTYPFIPAEYGQPLAGCHNDVAIMREVLLEQDFDDGDVRVLVDRVEGCDCPFCREALPSESGSPTREGIVAAVRELTRDAREDDVVVFYFSGHGSELSGRGLYAGQRFQTIVTHDSGRGANQNRDIADREIEGWIRDFHRKTPYLTLIFDCCHSGGIADLRGGEAVGRRVKADERTAAEAFAPPLRTLLEERPQGGGREPRRGPSGWLRGAGRSAIVLSASAAKEYSSETAVDGRKQGLFTCQLAAALGRRETSDLTWADVFPEIAEAVTRENLSQHPRREGNSPIFARGEIDPDDVYPPDVVELEKLAVVIGIDYNRPQADSGEGEQVRAGFPPLRAPQRDAEQLARVLGEVQGYEIVGLSRRLPGPLLNENATRGNIHKVINRLVRVKARIHRETAVVIYFAGHGVVRLGDDGEHAGYLVPWDADPEDPSTWLPMKDLRDQLVDGIRDPERLEKLEQEKPLTRLTSRHLLLVLDCCFGGALAFDFFRGGGAPDRPIYYSEYRRFVEGTAWQLLSSASYNQQAMDRDPKNPAEPHSPFARALLEGLATAAADSLRRGSRSDQIVTAVELHQFIDTRLQEMGVDVQTPGLMPLRPLRGQFIFHVPGFRPSPLPDPPLRSDANPWRGEKAYEEASELFCGRELATLDLLERFLESPRPLAVVGSSGSGKTSLVRAGLLPLLENPIRERQRLRSWLRRQGWQHYLISAEDLGEVREWAHDLSLDACLDRPEELAAKVREEAAGAEPGTDATQVGAHLQREKLGVPSFDEGAKYALLNRLGLLGFPDRPQELAERLRLWLKEDGIADFLSKPDKELERWDVVTELQAAKVPADSNAPGVLLLIDPLEEKTAIQNQAWRSFAAGDRARTVAVVRSDALSRDPDLARALAARDEADRPLWKLYDVPRPTRAELREVVLGPAAAGVLRFEPPELVDRLVAEVEETPAPFPLLSLTLSRMVERAWDRRQDADRQLLNADLEAAAEILSRRAEDTYRELLKEDPLRGPILRCLILRAVSLDDKRRASRPVTWRELELTGSVERESLKAKVLPELVKARVMVAGRDHVELACAGLIDAWARLRLWVRDCRLAPGGLHALWRRALEWESGDFARGKLWNHEPMVRRLFRSTMLPHLERGFVVSSEMSRRSATMMALAAAVVRDLDREWQRSAVLAAAATAVGIETREITDRLLEEPQPAERELQEARKRTREAREVTWRAAEQALHDVLAATPFSVPLSIPDGKIGGLRFDRDDALLVRIDDHGYAWNLRDLAEPPWKLSAAGLPEPGEGRPQSPPIGPVMEFPLVPVIPRPGPHPKAQRCRDNAVRYFTPGQLNIPIDLSFLAKPPTALLGHQGVPTFLEFSDSESWLVSAANLAEGGAEVRLWPIREPWGMPGQPRSLLGEDDELRKVFDPTGPFGGGSELRVSDFANLPVTVLSWRIESIARDGSAFKLRDLTTQQVRTVELLPRQPRVRVEREGPFPGAPPLSKHLPPLPPPPPLPGRPDPDQGMVREMVFSPDGRWLAAVSLDGDAWLRSLPDLTLRWSAKGRVATMAFSPDGGRLAIGELAGAVHLGTMGPDASSEVLVSPVILRSRFQEGLEVRALAFDREGRRLAVERHALYHPYGGRVDVYQLELEELIRLARGHAGRGPEPSDLTRDQWLDLFGVGPERKTEEGKEEKQRKEEKREAKKRYLKALGLREPQPGQTGPDS